MKTIMIVLAVTLINITAQSQARMFNTVDELKEEFKENEFEKTVLDDGFIYTLKTSDGLAMYFFDDETNNIVVTTMILYDANERQGLNKKIQMLNKEYAIVDYKHWVDYSFEIPVFIDSFFNEENNVNIIRYDIKDHSKQE